MALGWGQKATQFHGSLGKQSAKEAPRTEVGPAVPWDDLQPRVSWRGDGEYFVCSSVDSKTGGRGGREREGGREEGGREREGGREGGRKGGGRGREGGRENNRG